MHDANRLAAINTEQLATATDRWLLRGGRAYRPRPRLPSLTAPVRIPFSGTAEPW